VTDSFVHWIMTAKPYLKPVPDLTNRTCPKIINDSVNSE